MSSSMVGRFVALVLCLVVALAVACTASKPDDASKESQLLPYIRELCQDNCLNLLKDEGNCVVFCSFHDHIEERHADEISRLWRRASFNTQPLEWAMGDLVRSLFSEKVDDPHKAAELYQDLIEHWYRRLSGHNEL